MKTTTQGYNNQNGYVSQQKRLSFYEENYILEPEDINVDRGFFKYEGDIESEGSTYLSMYEIAV